MQSCNQAAVHGHFTVQEKVSWNFTLGTNNSIEHPDFPLKQNGSVIPETHFSRSRLAKKRILIAFGILKMKHLSFFKLGFWRRRHTGQFKSIFGTQTPKSFLFTQHGIFFFPSSTNFFPWSGESLSLSLHLSPAVTRHLPPFPRRRWLHTGN